MTELDRCRPWIAAALEHAGGTHTVADIEAGVQAGTLQLWPAPDGCLITEIVEFPRKRVLNVFLGGGTMRQLLDMRADVAAWAKAQGCHATTINGRPGWERVFRRYGWRPVHVCLSKEIEP